MMIFALAKEVSQVLYHWKGQVMAWVEPLKSDRYLFRFKNGGFCPRYPNPQITLDTFAFCTSKRMVSQVLYHWKGQVMIWISHNTKFSTDIKLTFKGRLCTYFCNRPSSCTRNNTCTCTCQCTCNPQNTNTEAKANDHAHAPAHNW